MALDGSLWEERAKHRHGNPAFNLIFLLAIQRVPISKELAPAGIIAAVLPFGPFVFDRWLGELRNVE